MTDIMKTGMKIHTSISMQPALKFGAVKPDTIILPDSFQHQVTSAHLERWAHEDLFRAVENGSFFHLATGLIRYPQLLNALCPQKDRTLLHNAILQRNPGIIAFLLKAGADPNLKNSLEITPFQMAVIDPQISVKVIEQMLVHQADLFSALSKHENRNTLHLACRYGSAATVRRLLEKNLQPALLKDSAENTVFHIASFNEDPGVLHALFERQMLLAERGITPWARNNFDYLPLDHAVVGIKHQAVAMLGDKGANTANCTGDTLMHWAAHYDDYHGVRQALAAGGDPNLQNDQLHTPLHYAARKGNIPMLKLLLEAGARPDIEDKQGNTPLYMAGSFHPDNPDIANLLLSYHLKKHVTPLKFGSNPSSNQTLPEGLQVSNQSAPDKQVYADLFRLLENNAPDKLIARLSQMPKAVNNALNESGHTLLHMAVMFKNVPFVRWLLQHGADPNAYSLQSDEPDDFRSPVTPLQSLAMAAEHNHCSRQLLELLVAGGADLSLITVHRRENLLHLIGANPQSSVLLGDIIDHLKKKCTPQKNILNNLLGQRNAHGQTPFHLAAENGHRDHVMQLLAAGSDTSSSTTKMLWKPLHLAAEHHRTDIIAQLLEGGANPNALSRGNSTPLHVVLDKPEFISPDADSDNRKQCFDLLLQAGADVHAVNDKGRTIMQMAARFPDSYYLQKVFEKKPGFKNMGDIDAVNDQGETALHLACTSGSFENVQLLLKAGANPRKITENKETVFHRAAQNPDSQVLNYFLTLEAHQGKKFITTRFHPGKAAKDGVTPLGKAVAAGNEENLKQLLKHPKTISESHEGLIQTAINHYRHELIPILIAHGTNLDQVSKHNATALGLAIQTSDFELVKTLLEAGANPNVQDDSGRSALHSALNFYRGDFIEEPDAILKLLLQHGADLTIPDNDGHDAVTWVLRVHRDERSRPTRDTLLKILGVNPLDITPKDVPQ